jgi:hypothetical protein
MNTYPDQRYSNEHLAKKLLELKINFEIRLKQSNEDNRWRIRREWIVAQIICLREGRLIKNDIYREMDLL